MKTMANTPEPKHILDLAVELLILIIRNLDSFADLRALQLSHSLFYRILQPTVQREQILFTLAERRFAPNWEHAYNLLLEQKEQNFAYTSLRDEDEAVSRETSQRGKPKPRRLTAVDVRQLLSNARYIKLQETRFAAYKMDCRRRGSSRITGFPRNELTPTERARFHRALYRFWLSQLESQGTKSKLYNTKSKLYNGTCSHPAARLSITEFTDFVRASDYMAPRFCVDSLEDPEFRGLPWKARITDKLALERKVKRKIEEAACGNHEIETQLRLSQLEYDEVAMLDEGLPVAAEVERLVKEAQKGGKRPIQLRPIGIRSMVFRPSILRRRP
ncbi:hypothetical protein RUND412_005633 [Rhizina undulata]